MISFENAVKMGCTGIETDVQMTKDGVLVLIHDEMVNRTTNGYGLVKDYNYLELCKLDAGSWFSKKFANQKIPALEELILFAEERGIILNLEIKSGIIEYHGIEEKIIDFVCRHNMQDRVILSSFNHYSTVKCKEILPEIKTGLLYSTGLYKPEKYGKFVGADALHPNFYVINGEIIREIKKEGLMTNTYTVNDTNYMKYFIDLEIDGIITNYPDKLKGIMEDKSK
jgi:glycerophosphoryl diester phosphodiesterase